MKRTWKLMVGFKLIKLHKLKMKQMIYSLKDI